MFYNPRDEREVEDEAVVGKASAVRDGFLLKWKILTYACIVRRGARAKSGV